MRIEYRIAYIEPRIASERMIATIAADNEDEARRLFAAGYAGAAIADVVAWSHVPADDPSQAYKRVHDETRRHFDGLDLIPPALERELLENGRQAAAAIDKDGNTADVEPVVKLFTPWTGATWLLSELDPAAPDIAFGLCDLGMGSPELGSVSLAELRAIRGPGGLRVERDIHFRATQPLSGYTAEARSAGRIKA